MCDVLLIVVSILKLEVMVVKLCYVLRKWFFLYNHDLLFIQVFVAIV